jgi:hypothetical protein
MLSMNKSWKTKLIHFDAPIPKDLLTQCSYPACVDSRFPNAEAILTDFMAHRLNRPVAFASAAIDERIGLAEGGIPNRLGAGWRRRYYWPRAQPASVALQRYSAR